ncbi:MAG: epoxyqueuosine reductase QueH, partial [Clostridia bacterium]|nr:epoxyqueuosine reductase QueH [Clostridia bacterium]
AEFYDRVKGLEKEKEGGKRCEACFKLRLEKTAKFAAAGGWDYFTTTLTLSPLKDARLLNEIGENAARGDAKWLYCDFKKRDGYLDSIKLSEKYGLYRQNYCGCAFSRSNS